MYVANRSINGELPRNQGTGIVYGNARDQMSWSGSLGFTKVSFLSTEEISLPRFLL